MGESQTLGSNVHSIFLKYVRAQNFLCATFYHSCIFRTTCMKSVQKHFKRKICVRSKFYCVRSSHDLCAGHTRAQLRGTIAGEADKKRVAIVNSRANKGMVYCSDGGCGSRFAESSKANCIGVTNPKRNLCSGDNRKSN